MTKYRNSDSVFLEKGGHDSSYQAVAALNLQVWTTYFPDEKLDAAVERAVGWLRGRVAADGRIDVIGNTRTGLGQEQWRGHDKGVDLSEITLCLLYDFARTGDPDSLAAARRIISGENSRIFSIIRSQPPLGCDDYAEFADELLRFRAAACRFSGIVHTVSQLGDLQGGSLNSSRRGMREFYKEEEFIGRVSVFGVLIV